MNDAIINFLGFHRYYGLDWAAALFMFLSMYRLGVHKKDGFVFAALASVCWIIFNIIALSAAGVVANLIIVVMAVRSLYKWHSVAESHNEVTLPTQHPTEPEA